MGTSLIMEGYISYYGPAPTDGSFLQYGRGNPLLRTGASLTADGLIPNTNGHMPTTDGYIPNYGRVHLPLRTVISLHHGRVYPPVREGGIPQ